jgi:hypothetical protein
METICKSSQCTTQRNKVSKGRHLTSSTEVLISPHAAGEEDELTVADVKAEEENEPKEYPIASFVVKT